MSDRFFTFMIVPERSGNVRKITLPSLYLRAALIVGGLLALLGAFIFFDYLHVLSQVAENKKLRVENHQIRQDVQDAKNKLEALDQSVGRLKSFAHKLRVLANLDQPGANKIIAAPEDAPTGGSFDHEESGNIEDPGAAPKTESKGLKRKGAKGKHREPEAEPAPPPSSSGDESRAEPEPRPDLIMVHDRHDSLEEQRARSLLVGEFGAGFDTADLIEQVSRITTATSKLNEIAELEEQAFADLYELLQDRVDRLLSTPSLLPAPGWISSEFGHRYNPFVGVRTFHAGMDIANRPGTTVVAPAEGIVTWAGLLGGFGTVVRIDHGYNIVTKFGHNSRIFVKTGDKVRRGQKIAEIGNSGRSTGPHVHYQVEVGGHPVNPRNFILEDTF